MIGAHSAVDSVVVRAADTTQIRFALRLIPFVVETLPPRFARGTRPDTAPAGTETIDLVSRVGKIPLLRATLPRGARELRFWIGGGISIPMTMLRLTIHGNRVDGQVVHWLNQWIPARDDSPSWRAFMDTVPSWLHQGFGCGPVTMDTLRYAAGQANHHDRLVAVCASRYPHEPDWRALLRELEAHNVWTLPDNSELPTIANIVTNDGGGVTTEAWDGKRYHSYTFGNTELIPAPEARDAAAIHRALITFLTRLHDDLHPRSK
jgi:hypothetical protein